LRVVDWRRKSSSTAVKTRDGSGADEELFENTSGSPRPGRICQSAIRETVRHALLLKLKSVVVVVVLENGGEGFLKEA
jgi:hypothetical protein